MQNSPFKTLSKQGTPTKKLLCGFLHNNTLGKIYAWENLYKV